MQNPHPYPHPRILEIPHPIHLYYIYIHIHALFEIKVFQDADISTVRYTSLAIIITNSVSAEPQYNNK